MKIRIKRFNDQESYEQTFETSKSNLLEVLNDIKYTQDNSLSFRCGCKSGVCGSCAVRVNGVERLSCKTKINENDLVEPLKNRAVIKDLITDVSHETFLIKQTNSYIEEYKENTVVNKENVKLIDIQSNCILCNSCYSSCPIYEVNPNFIGPFALTRALRYVNDNKSSSNSKILNSIQENGIWDCTLCSACTLVCPQKIDPKMDIMNLQNISVQNGFENPHLKNYDSFGFDSNNMGFDPNGF